MTLFIDIEMPHLRGAIELIVKANGATLAPTPDEAEVVVSNDQRKLLGHLKTGKRVVQLCLPGAEVAIGLATAPDFADRFRAFRVLLTEDEAEFRKFMAYVAGNCEEVR